MKKRNLSAMRDQYLGRPAAVLGGGPSLVADLHKVPSDTILIAVNYHAFYHCRPHFMVYNDQPESDPLLLDRVQNTGAVRVSSDPSSDVVFDVNIWTGFYSSNTAAWFALWLGCEPVILCGMDCYQGPVKYCHPSDRDVPTHHYPLDHHLRPWLEDGRNLLPHVERLRVASGPLTSIFPVYAS